MKNRRLLPFLDVTVAMSKSANAALFWQVPTVVEIACYAAVEYVLIGG